MGFGKGFKFGDAPTEKPSIDKFKLEVDEVKYITILDTDDIFVSQTHFLLPMGQFHCWRTEDEDGVHKGSCCKIMEDLHEKGIAKNAFPTNRLVLPIAVFRVKADGKTVDTGSVSFSRLELTNDDYKDLIGAINDEEDIEIDNITKHLIRVRGEESGKGQYKRVAPKFKPRSTKTPLLADPDLKALAKDFLAKYRELISDVMGKTIDEDKLNRVSENLLNEAGEVTNRPEVKPELKPEAKTAPSKPVAKEPDLELVPDIDEPLDLGFFDDDEFLND